MRREATRLSGGDADGLGLDLGLERFGGTFDLETYAEQPTTADTEVTAIFNHRPDDFGEPGSGSPRDHASSFEPAATAAGFARASDGGSDLPPWEGADESQLPSDRGSTAPRDSHGPTTEQLVKRMAATLEKIERSISPEFAEAFHALPQKLRNRLIRAAEALQEKMADLGA